MKLDTYPMGPIPKTGGPNSGWVIGSAQISIQPAMNDFTWNLRNEVREMRRQGLIWLIGERFILELKDLNDLCFDYLTFKHTSLMGWES